MSTKVIDEVKYLALAVLNLITKNRQKIFPISNSLGTALYFTDNNVNEIFST